MKNQNLWKGYLYVILSAVMFGLMPIMAKYIYREGVTSVSLAFFRNFLSLPFILAIIYFNKNSIKIPSVAVPGILAIALGAAATSLLLYSSYNHIPSGSATVLHFVYPAAVILGEFLFLKNKLSATHILSVIICVAGIALFYNPQNKLNFTGSFLAILSGITYATYIILLSVFKHKDIPTFTFSFYLFGIMTIILFMVCVFSHQLTFPQSLKGWVLIIAFSVIFNVLAAVLFQKGTFLVGSGRASILSTLEPVTSVFAGFAFLNEKITLFTLGGTLLVIGASILITANDFKKSTNKTKC